ncbi:MAG: HEAT repeat domain-containing protein [Planctomycetes bacterium]|nr:HEAT repeat domain-containing protein [Planctomycetota bacterium]
MQGGLRDEVRALASELRAALRQDAEILQAAGAILLDPTESERLRGTLALILGTLRGEEAQAFLLKALEGAGRESDLTKWLLYALGAWKERADFDERFAFPPDGPWVVESPAGLRLPIRAVLDDSAVVEVVEGYLRHAKDSGVRLAAAQALRHSLEVERVREEFLETLGLEIDSAVHAECAEALGEWTVTADVPQAVAVREKLLEEAALPQADLLRLKIEPAMRSAPLTAREAEAVAQLLGARSDDLGSRYFAMEVAGAQVPLLLEDPHRRASGERLVALLLQTLAGDAEPKLREKAAEKLGRVPGPMTVAGLLSAAERDSAWNVRLAAARALGPAADEQETIRSVLERLAQSDPDPRVRRAAAESLGSRSRGR